MTPWRLCVVSDDGQLISLASGAIADERVPGLCLGFSHLQASLPFLRLVLHNRLAARFDLLPVGNELRLRVLTKEAT